MGRQLLVSSLLAISLFALTLVIVPLVLASVRIENEGNVPYYARLGGNEIHHTADWAVIVFYRPPKCVPAGFNLLEFIDAPRAFSCTPPTTDGFSLWRNGPGLDPAPYEVDLQGRGAVPVWFASWPQLQAAVADGVLTIGELETLPSLLKGTASSYQETLHPEGPGAAKIGKIEFNARGVLANARTFQVAVSGHGGSERDTNVKIDFK